MAIAKSRLGKDGEIIIPSSLTRFLGLKEGEVVEIEVNEDGIMIRPSQLPIEVRKPKDAEGE